MNSYLSIHKAIHSKVKNIEFHSVRSLISKSFSIITLLVVFIIFQILTEGRLLSSRNFMNIFNNMFNIGLCSVGIMFLMSQGELDLSVGAIVGFASAIGAFSAKISLFVLLPVTVLTGLFVGLVNGLIISKLRVSSFIATLAMSFVVRGLTTFLLNGSLGVPLSLRVVDNNLLKITLFIVIAIGSYLLFEYTKYGKQCRSIGSSKQASIQSGVDVANVKLTAFLISGAICGLIAFFGLARTGTATSSTGSAFEFEVLLAVLIGGMQLTGGWEVRFRAAIIGSLSMAVIKNGMSLIGFAGLTQQVVQGVLLIIIVAITFDRRNSREIK